MTVQTDGLLAAGDVYFGARKTDGSNENLAVLNAGKLAIKHNSETKDIISKGRDTYGQLVATVAVPKPADLTVDFGKISPKALAMGLQGSASAYSQGSGTATAQAVTATKGASIDLGKRNITAAGFVVKSNDGNTTYTISTDYTVDYVGGLLHIPSTSTIVDAATIKVDYAYAAVSGDKIVGGTTPNVRGKIVMEGKNLADGSPITVTVWDATLSSETEIDWLSDNPVNISMKGRMVTPTGKTGPYEVIANQVLS